MEKKKSCIIPGVVIAVIIVIPITCLLALIASYHIYQEKNIKSIKSHIDQISRTVESNQDILIALCQYELSNAPGESMTEIKTTGEYQEARDIIFNDLFFDSGATTGYTQESIRFFRHYGKDYIILTYTEQPVSDELLTDHEIKIGEHFVLTAPIYVSLK